MYEYKLNFCLNEYQLSISESLLNLYKKKKDILLDAVCGAGKTEMLLETICYALNDNKKVGFACPRKQLTIELYERINEYFNHDNIGLIVGGVKININSNLIFLTTHQLAKYKNYFDLLIIDEVDAFPFLDNYTLEQDALLAAKQFIYLSATVPQKYYDRVIEKSLSYLTNHSRHHGKQSPIPKIVKTRKGLMHIKLITLIKEYEDNPLIIFVPSIKEGFRLSNVLNLLQRKNIFVYGANITQEKLNEFKSKKDIILISTTVLERGITINKLNVIVFNCSNKIFDKQTLIQICGRVGRNQDNPNGNIIFLVENESISAIDAAKEIERNNEMLLL